MAKRQYPGQRERQNNYDQFIKDMMWLVHTAKKRKITSQEWNGLREYLKIMELYTVK